MKYLSNHDKKPLESTFVLELDIGTIRTIYSQEMDFGSLSQNEVSRSLIPKIGLKSQYVPTSLVSWWDMCIIKIF